MVLEFCDSAGIGDRNPPWPLNTFLPDAPVISIAFKFLAFIIVIVSLPAVGR